jgi:hypothetical protein|tara:strand:+ start:6269 stop:6700 length:432 start_codon:yes stop_codon:yes gene_type:complete
MSYSLILLFCVRGYGGINTSMINYVVRGPNWKININISEPFDSDYAYVEAATRAIEKIYNDDPTVELFNDDETPKFTSVIQVSMKEHDITIPILDSTKSEGLKELAEENVVNGLIRFLGTPLILANAGRYAQAEFLKGIIEND